jgi:hypothetical protein
LIDVALVNNRKIPAAARRPYAKQHALPVEADVAQVEELVPETVATDLLAKGLPLRHDSDRLARMLLVKAQENWAQRRGVKAR